MAEAPLVVAVAGAAGFVGRALCHALAREAGVIALSRRPECAGADAAEPGVTWRYADLFSLLQTENALQGADVAVYLVHSMLPHARLTQGAFEDVDFILADNFARAARRAGVKKILFLGGIIPKGERLSRHLASRLEVERVLASHGVPVVTARAGLIVGADGSSFRILERLVRRLPLMLCPAWTVTRGQPIYLDDVVAVLVRAALDPELPAGAYDLAGTDRLTYREMLEHTAEALGKRPKADQRPLFLAEGLALVAEPRDGSASSPCLPPRPKPSPRFEL